MECKFFKLKPFLLSCGRIAGMVIVIILGAWADIGSGRRG